MIVVYLCCMCAYMFGLLWSKRPWELSAVHLIVVILGVVENGSPPLDIVERKTGCISR